MKTRLRFGALLLLCAPVAAAWAEGSRQLTPNLPATPTDLRDPANTRAGFLTHDAIGGENVSLGFLKPKSWEQSGLSFSDDYRLYIRLKPGETLHYGVHRSNFGPSNYAEVQLTLRYGSGAGTIVKQNTLARDQSSANQHLLNINQPGVIDDAAQSRIGPAALGAGGYEALTYTNTTGQTRDFFVEFTQAGEYTDAGTQPGFNDLGTRASGFSAQRRSEFDFWDFTVLGADGKEKPGRLFSKFWSFTAGQSTGTQYEHRLSSTFALYPLITSPQNPGLYYVKQIELAGMRPFVFYFVANANGSVANAANGTTFAERRKSQVGNTGYAEYPIFVNNPDEEFWPSAPTPVFATSSQGFCNPSTGRGGVAFTTLSDEQGFVSILIDLNGNKVKDGSDVLLEQTVVPGANTTVWNGLDASGNPVAQNTAIKLSFVSNGAPVNFPVYDAEGNPDGLRIQNIRPSVGGNIYYDRLYWDDSRLTAARAGSFPAAPPVPDGSNVRLDGVISSTDAYQGVHRWGDATNEAGNNVTVNTWTYGFISAPSEITYTFAFDCDFDKDGVADSQDLDDDNDGLPDLAESNNVNPETLSNGVVSYLDGAFVTPNLGGFRDVNRDGVNDLFDTDLDGLPNHHDLDADGDGIVDARETGPGSASFPVANTFDANGRVAPASFVDANGNGLHDAFQTTPLLAPDTDGDGVVNPLDQDSDNDGILDLREAQTTAAYQDAKTDADRDGVADVFDPSNPAGTAAGTALVPVNTDATGSRDYLDADTDDDTYPDWTEGFDDNHSGFAADDLMQRGQGFRGNNPGRADNYPGGPNPAWLRDDDADNVPNFMDANSNHFRDTNRNGLADLVDPTFGGVPSKAPKRTPAQADADFRFAGTVTPLPVTLTRFEAQARGVDGVLTWETAQEVRNAGFTVERSVDAVQFVPVGQVAGRGTTSQAQQYQFTDLAIGRTARLVYYRLQQRDLDGTVHYSPVKPVRFGKDQLGGVALYPNPTTDATTLDLTSQPTGSYTVEVLGAEGRKVAVWSAQGGIVNPLPTAALAKGVYLLRLAGPSQHVLKLVKE